MNDVPLVKANNIHDINTSIIAIKKQFKQLNEAVGLIDMPTIDTSIFVKKSEVVDVVEEGNMNPVTSNAVVPVDEVTSGNMQSVTSNAVAEKFNDSFNILQNLTIHKIWGTLSDYDTQDVELTGGHTYLFINTHVLAVEIIMFSLYEGNITQAARLTGAQVTTITGIGENAVRLTSNGACRGYIFKIGDTAGT